MRRGLIAALVVAALVVAAVLYQQRRRADEAEWRAGIDATRIVNLVFDRHADLRVAQLKGTMVTRTDADGCLGLCHGQQMTRAPVAIDYFVDLAGLPTSAYRWNREARLLYVTVPEVTAAPPNVDMAAAQVRQNGAWISRDMGVRMQQRAAANLKAKSEATARDPANVSRAREAGRAAIARLLAAPLAAAGLGRVEVRVRFPFDARPADDRRWDVSRPIDEVLADPRFSR